MCVLEAWEAIVKTIQDRFTKAFVLHHKLLDEHSNLRWGIANEAVVHEQVY